LSNDFQDKKTELERKKKKRKGRGTVCYYLSGGKRKRRIDVFLSA